jgi:hypothetical protein
MTPTPNLDTLLANWPAIAAEIAALKAADGSTPPIPPVVVTPVIPPVGTPPSGTFNIPGCDTTRVVELTWPISVRLIVPMSFRDGIIVRFTTGNRFTQPNNLCKVSGAEFNSSPRPRIAALSNVPGDFSNILGGGAAGKGNSLSFPFSVGPNASGGYYPSLAKNTTYYVNVKNDPTGTDSNPCDMFFDLDVREV